VTVAVGSRIACSRRVDSSAPIRWAYWRRKLSSASAPASALGVVDHRDLEERAVGQHVLGDLA